MCVPDPVPAAADTSRRSLAGRRLSGIVVHEQAQLGAVMWVRRADRPAVAGWGCVATIVVAVLLLTPGVAACGSGGARRTNRASMSAIPGLKPGEDPAGQQLLGKQRGGTLTAYNSLGIDSLDPGQSYFDPSYPIEYATQRPLFAYRPNSYSTPSPDMAAYMPTDANGGITDGGRTVTVHIRPNVHFSPPVNRAVTSADIAYA